MSMPTIATHSPDPRFSGRFPVRRTIATVALGAAALLAAGCTSTTEAGIDHDRAAECQGTADSFARAFAAKGDMTPKTFYCTTSPDLHSDKDALSFPVNPAKFANQPPSPVDPDITQVASECTQRAASLSQSPDAAGYRPNRTMLCDLNPAVQLDDGFLIMPVGTNTPGKMY